MSQINVRNLSNENEDGAPDIVGVSTFSATSYIVPPVGTTAQRPTNPQDGDLRFNTDSASLEYFRGDTLNWSQIEMTSPDLNGGARALFQSGSNPALSPVYRNTVDYSTIPTLGNATDFGDLVAGRSWCTAGCASRTRAVAVGGYTHPNITDQIDYATISSTGNYADFGNLTAIRTAAGGSSSATRGLFCGGNPANNATKTNSCDYITTASTGNATDFGDLTTAANDIPDGFSNSTRGVRAGGVSSAPNTKSNVIDYITMATAGNATDFGDLINATSSTVGAASSPTRGIIAGTDKSPTTYGNVIEYVEIMTTGNAKDFGDLSENRSHGNGVSNAHGGL